MARLSNRRLVEGGLLVTAPARPAHPGSAAPIRDQRGFAAATIAMRMTALNVWFESSRNPEKSRTPSEQR